MKIQVYSVEQAAEILGAKPSTIRTYCREGKIPALKIGRSYRIAEEDLKRWLRSQKRDSGFLEDEDQRAKEAEKKYKDLFENANDAILLINRRGRMTLANPKARELFGYTTEQI
jgi:excisionase family DNA binding protein